ncbi:putative phospholipase B-like 2 [Oppia nitens]|uniref:putative phospholipase B-like 2 n=1 Tax=Oppia nitens TaxID=1686743 RepID=UPI0023DAB7C2|nr:putative phospholipase B-like 2 [Oppia nitens]
MICRYCESTAKNDTQLAAEHFANILRLAKCHNPMQRYIPFATIINVCDASTGCCSDETQTCAAKTVQKVILHFLVIEVTADGNRKSVESISFDNHTQCHCKHVNSDETGEDILGSYHQQNDFSMKTSLQHISQESNSMTIYICKSDRIFYYVNDLTQTNWKSFQMGFTTDEELIPSNYIAWALYSNTINKTGFAQLEVHTNPVHEDSAQAYHAGFIEGYLTAQLMAMHWRNQIDLYCDNNQKYCKRMFKFLDKNLNITQEKAKALRNESIYWHQIGLIFEQLTGLQDGYNVKLWSHIPDKPGMHVDSKGMISLSIIPELNEFELILNKTIKHKTRDGSCSAFVKPLPDGSDLYVAHNTWVWYSMMLRIFKKYELNYRKLPNDNEIIPGRVSAFSSYPGALTSIDDFYILSSGLVVQETSLTNINSNLWKYIKPEKIVLEFVRNLVANRLAESGKQWTEIFEQNNSGTYNDQFMIVDYKQFIEGLPTDQLSNDLLWVLEQMPTFVKSTDVTDILRQKGYWASYNVPYFEEIFNLSGYNKLVELHGDYYSYNNTARALIFKRDQSKVRDLTTVYSLMRSNDFENDPLSRCNCVPPFTAEYAISARNDLNEPNGIYPLEAIGFRDWGAIDVKITTSEMWRRFEMLVVSSPSYEKHQPFQWSTTKLPKNIRHEGHPDKWAFPPYFIRWYPFDSELAGVIINSNQMRCQLC